MGESTVKLADLQNEFFETEAARSLLDQLLSDSTARRHRVSSGRKC